MLKLKNVSKFYYNKGIIASGFTKLNLELKLGEFVVITGESGSGKSTLLNVISGLDSYEEGEMYIQEKETSHYTEKDFEEYRRKYIANIFQSFNLINSYTVYQNVELVLLLNGYKKSEIEDKVLDMIDSVGLTEFTDTKVSKLSGGQKQRVAIARAMVKDTPIIVADEPTGNLDIEAAKEVIEILKEVAKDKLVIVVTHNIEQVEMYATRIIKMHDGRIMENTEIRKVEEEIEPEISKYNKITIFNKCILGIRNTFNIFTKFALLFMVFFFITVALLAEYSSFKNSEYEASKEGYNLAFSDLSDNRIIIKKSDNTAFSNEDYDRIKDISNIDYIVEDDLLIDTNISLYREIENLTLSLHGNIQNIDNFNGKIESGRMPENDEEIIVKSSKDNYYISEMQNDILGKTFSINEMSEGDEVKKVTIVGITYNEDEHDYNSAFYARDNMISDLRSFINQKYSKIKVLFNNKYTENYFRVLPSTKVDKGNAIVNDELKYEISKGNIKNSPISIEISNIYYNQELDLKVSSTYTKSNFNKTTGYNKYENYINAVFVNDEEYNEIYDRPSYQSSCYIIDTRIIDDTLNELKEIGIKPKKITDYKVTSGEASVQIVKIVKTVVTIILIFVLFFISYFIIKIILKSRNIYYTTLRMLGATYKSVKRILDIELFTNFSLSYLTILIFIFLVNKNIIGFEYVAKLTGYLETKEYVLMYVILAVMSLLISRRFSRKLFKNTAINTYNEEV